MDNDLPGRQGKKIGKKYTLMEYEVFVHLPPVEKDYNAFCSIKGNQELSSLVEKERPLLTETRDKTPKKIEKMVDTGT